MMKKMSYLVLGCILMYVLLASVGQAIRLADQGENVRQIYAVNSVVDKLKQQVDVYQGVKYEDYDLQAESMTLGMVPNYEFNLIKYDLSRAYDGFKVLYGSADRVWILAFYKQTNNFSSPLSSTLFQLDQATSDLKNYQHHDLNQIDNVHLNRFNKNILIFSNKLDRKIYLSNDNGVSLFEHTISFRPDVFYFTPDDQIIFSIEQIDSIKNNMWMSIDLGKNWFMLDKNIKKLPEWDSRENFNYTYYIDSNGNLIELNLNEAKKSSTNEENLHKYRVVLKENVLNFDITNEHLILTTFKNDLVKLEYKKKSNGMDDKWAKSDLFYKQTQTIVHDQRILWSDSKETLLGVFTKVNGKMKVDCYVSNDNLKSFYFSLDNLRYNQDLDSVELKVLNKLGGVFLANVEFSSSESEPSTIKTVMRTREKPEWNEIQFESNSTEKFHLNLSPRDLQFFHKYDQNFNDDPKAPEILLSSVTTEQSQYMYASNANLIDWSLSLKGDFAYAFGDNGNILLAVARSTPVKEFIYSYVGGTQWRRFKFSQQPLVVDAILNEPLEFSSRFILFATDPKTNSRLLIKLDLNSPETSTPISDECSKQCTFGSKVVCLHASSICNGKYECNDGQDEFYCPEITSKQTQTYSPNVLISPDSNLKSLFRLNIPHTYLKQDNFYFKYNIDFLARQEVHLNSYLIRVIRFKSDGTSFDILQGYDNQSSANQIHLTQLDPGYTYNVQFYANLTLADESEPRIIKVDDSLMFDIVESGPYIIGIRDFRRNLNYENVLIAILIAIVCLMCIVMFVFIARYIRQHTASIKPLMHRFNYRILQNSKGKEKEYRDYLISTVDESCEQGRVYNSPVV